MLPHPSIRLHGGQMCLDHKRACTLAVYTFYQSTCDLLRLGHRGGNVLAPLSNQEDSTSKMCECCDEGRMFLKAQASSLGPLSATDSRLSACSVPSGGGAWGTGFSDLSRHILDIWEGVVCALQGTGRDVWRDAHARLFTNYSVFECVTRRRSHLTVAVHLVG